MPSRKQIKREIKKAAERAVEELEGKHRTPQLTSKQYAEERGLRCPYCLDDFIIIGSTEVDEEAAEAHNTCMVCDAEWTEIYHLVGYREV